MVTILSPKSVYVDNDNAETYTLNWQGTLSGQTAYEVLYKLKSSDIWLTAGKVTSTATSYDLRKVYDLLGIDFAEISYKVLLYYTTQTTDNETTTGTEYSNTYSLIFNQGSVGSLNVWNGSEKKSYPVFDKVTNDNVALLNVKTKDTVIKAPLVDDESPLKSDLKIRVAKDTTLSVANKDASFHYYTPTSSDKFGDFYVYGRNYNNTGTGTEDAYATDTSYYYRDVQYYYISQYSYRYKYVSSYSGAYYRLYLNGEGVYQYTYDRQNYQISSYSYIDNPKLLNDQYTYSYMKVYHYGYSNQYGSRSFSYQLYVTTPVDNYVLGSGIYYYEYVSYKTLIDNILKDIRYSYLQRVYTTYKYRYYYYYSYTQTTAYDGRYTYNYYNYQGYYYYSNYSYRYTSDVYSSSTRNERFSSDYTYSYRYNYSYQYITDYSYSYKT
jgi:hypothetical protein